MARYQYQRQNSEETICNFIWKRPVSVTLCCAMYDITTDITAYPFRIQDFEFSDTRICSVLECGICDRIPSEYKTSSLVIQESVRFLNMEFVTESLPNTRLRT
jgi:hypothetical protein